MTDVDIVIGAAERTKEQMIEFAYGDKIEAQDFRAVVQCIGIFHVFIEQLNAMQAAEMPR